MPPRPHLRARPASVRDVALGVLTAWSQQRHFALELLDAACRREHLPPPDAGLLHHIVLGVIRNLSLLDHWITALCPNPHLDHRTRWVLRIGLAQLLLLEMPPHAAVNETVEIAGKARALVNAILRRADRERDALVTAVASLPLHVRTSHPSFLVRRWCDVFGAARAAAFCTWNQNGAETFVRLNPLHPGAADWITTAPGLAPVGGGFYRCDSLPRAALAAGLCYAQDPATAIAPLMLAPQPGEVVLDACAAPGGKTALLAALMQNEGRIIAADAAAPRLTRLRENLSALRVTNAEIVLYDLASDHPPPWGSLLFDRILLDVPCSNTGVMRRRVDVRWRLGEDDIAQSAALQVRLLQNALGFLKPGGTLVYSTCSIDPAENREVIDSVIIRPESRSPSRQGMAFQAVNGPGLPVLAEERFLFPPDARSDGAYAARLWRDEKR